MNEQLWQTVWDDLYAGRRVTVQQRAGVEAGMSTLRAVVADVQPPRDASSDPSQESRPEEFEAIDAAGLATQLLAHGFAEQEALEILRNARLI